MLFTHYRKSSDIVLRKNAINILLHTPTHRMTHNLRVKFANGYSEEQGGRDLLGLQNPHGRWNISANGMGLERHFKFKGFKKAWEFMNLVAEEAVKKRHHPEWSNEFYMRWTTHAPVGLSEKDVVMARFCDEKAMELGEILDEDQENSPGSGKELINNVVEIAKNCCVPKKN